MAVEGIYESFSTSTGQEAASVEFIDSSGCDRGSDGPNISIWALDRPLRAGAGSAGAGASWWISLGGIRSSSRHASSYDYFSGWMDGKDAGREIWCGHGGSHVSEA